MLAQLTFNDAWATEMTSSQPKAISRTRRLIVTEPPANGFECFQPTEPEIEYQANHTDYEHRRNDQVIAFARVSGVDHQVAETGVDGNHLRCHNHQPRNPERNPQSDDDLRQRGRKDDPGEELGWRQAEVAAGAAEH